MRACAAEFVARSGAFVEFAAQGAQCSAAHARYVTDTAAQRIMWLSQLRSTNGGNAAVAFEALLDSWAAEDRDIFVSFDLDAVSGADAPVRSPSRVDAEIRGLTLAMCVAGRERRRNDRSLGPGGARHMHDRGP